MSNILTIAYTTEGSTDERFLENIIRNTFEDLALKCEGSIEVYNPIFIKFPHPATFADGVISVAKKAFEIGINILCIHLDADNATEIHVTTHKLVPAKERVNTEASQKICKNIAAVIPVYMTESWMLADKELFKEEIGTNKSDDDLGINKKPEEITNPKKIIEDALIEAQNHLPKRRKRLAIADLYQPLGQKIALEHLENLDSFRKFKASAEDALRNLNYLQ